jgi:hypothetical protein
LSLNRIIKGMDVRRMMWEITILALPNLYVNTEWLTQTRQFKLKARGLIAGKPEKLASKGANIAS